MAILPNFSSFAFLNIANTTRYRTVANVEKICYEENWSSPQRSSVRKDVLRNFAKFAGKHLCQSLFLNKVVDWSLQLYLKRLWHRCFPVNFSKFLMKTFLKGTSSIPIFSSIGYTLTELFRKPENWRQIYKQMRLCIHQTF